MGGSSEGDACSIATTSEAESCKPWIKEKVLGTGGFGTVILWKNENSGETIGKYFCKFSIV